MKEFPKNYLMQYNGGFYEVPYLANSPMAMVESFKDSGRGRNVLPNSLIFESKYSDGIMRYRKIEEGFWVFVTDLTFKENVKTKILFDENLSSDYYYLKFSVFENEFSFKNNALHKVSFVSTCWSFYKPETEVTNYFFKGAAVKIYNFAFNKKWADENLFFTNKETKVVLDDLLNNRTGLFKWIDVVPNELETVEEISQIIENEDSAVVNSADIKDRSLKLITDFFKHSSEEEQLKNNSSLSNSDYSRIVKAEKVILSNLGQPFVGVETIAAEVNMSPTKLKSNFKSVFGFSLLQFYKEYSMLFAQQLLKKSDMDIRDIAELTGYKSASKFSASFKKRFNMLPSELRIQNAGS